MDTGLRRLRYFVALAQERNFRRASRKLGLTQPALSRAMALLETDVGVTLLDRRGRGVGLTPAGEAFLPGCERVMSALGQAIQAARKVAEGSAGTLTIGYTDTVIAGALPDIVRAFRTANPGVGVHLRQAFSHRQLSWLDSGELDVAFMTEPEDRPDRASITIQEDRLVAVLPYDHPLAAHDVLPLAAMAPFPFVLGDPVEWSVFNERLLGLCYAAGFTPDVLQVAPDSRGIVGLVSCGMGISVQTESLLRHRDGRIAVRPLLQTGAVLKSQAVWLLTNENPALERLLNVVRERAHQERLIAASSGASAADEA